MSNLFNNISSSNTLVIGRQSLKKYQQILIPYILSSIESGESFIATDPEDIILRQLGGKLEENGYSIISFNMRNPQKSNSWNPLYVAYEAYKDKDIELCIHLLNSVATIIMSDDTVVHSSDPFWELSSIDLFVGLALILFKEAKVISQINISSIYYMAQKSFTKLGNLTILDNYFSEIGDNFDIAKNTLSSILSAPIDTRGSILSVFYQKIRAFTVKDMFLKNLCSNDITLEDITKSKTAIIICYEAENSIHDSLVKIFLRQFINILMKKRDVLKFNEERYHFIITNFLTVGCFPEIDRFISSCNNRNIDVLLDVYSINALFKLYGKETTALIFSQCSIWYITQMKEAELQMQINQLLLSSGQENSKLKSIFNLMPNEIMVIEDGQSPRIETVEEYHFSETSFIFQYQTKYDSISIFKFDDLVKEKKRDVFLMSDSQRGINPFSLEKTLNVDDLIEKIDRRIAELEINKKIEEATKDNDTKKNL